VTKYKVLIVEDDDDLRESTAQLFELSEDVLVYAAAGLMGVQNFGAIVFTCSLAVIDINLGPNLPSGIDVFKWLRAHGFSGKIAFLTGHGVNHPLVFEASLLDGVEVYQKPMGLEQLLLKARADIIPPTKLGIKNAK
jgi:DNA-binding response OmpR family regulator